MWAIFSYDQTKPKRQDSKSRDNHNTYNITNNGEDRSRCQNEEYLIYKL